MLSRYLYASLKLVALWVGFQASALASHAFSQGPFDKMTTITTYRYVLSPIRTDYYGHLVHNASVPSTCIACLLSMLTRYDIVTIIILYPRKHVQ